MSGSGQTCGVIREERLLTMVSALVRAYAEQLGAAGGDPIVSIARELRQHAAVVGKAILVDHAPPHTPSFDEAYEALQSIIPRAIWGLIILQAIREAVPAPESAKADRTVH
ncbi:hypothetical protein [Acetobacter sp. DsW_063]|uniref:hypothetical protein n=1 Tax=Acetobacter sp. DsW_063 TaxID=1514894 RepID=UPI000A3D02FB|nr:hypothetical protein [Acetobacter sp. DsW_063]OUJ17083.1 hypothetical protein HK28_07900 [Acetobacter sp. DsW_063]